MAPQEFTKSEVTQSARRAAYQLVSIQGLVVVIIALIWITVGVPAFFSTLLGGVATVLPSLYFARRFFKTTSVQSVKKIMRAFYAGELVKLALNAVLVLLIVMLIPVMIVPFITGFVGAQFGFLFVPLATKLGAIKSAT